MGFSYSFAFFLIFLTFKGFIMKFSIQRKQLKGISRFAATKDIRHYLMGVCVTQNNRGTVIEATNGHMMGRLLINAEPMPENRVIIQSSDVDKLKGTKKTANEWLHFIIDGLKIEVITPDSMMTFQALEDRYPNTDRVQPLVLKDEDVKPSHFNPEYLMAFMQAAEDITGKKQIPRIIQRGEDAAVVLLPCVEDFVGVLMPVRDSVLGGTLPEWIYKPATKQEVEKEAV